MNPTARRTHSLLALLALLVSASACQPTYQPVRVFVPHPNKAHNVQIEANSSQLDVGYAVTDNLVASVGASYLTRSVKDTKTDSTRESSQKGAYLGFGYYKVLDAQGRTRLSATAGSSFEKWDYTNDIVIKGLEKSSLYGFTRFNATVINPFGQLAVTQGSGVSNISFALRLEKPIIDFSNTAPDTAQAKGSPTLLNIAVQSKYELFSKLSVYTQFVYRYNFDTENFNNLFGNEDTRAYTNAYEISSWNLYFGLSYELDFSDRFSEPSEGAQEKSAEVDPGEGAAE